jgi:tetratricopeptide (TPR) repeat protein
MFHRILVTAFLLVFGARIASAQPGATTGGIRGKVVVPTVGFGERLEILIEKPGEEGHAYAVTYTDSLGSYFINGLPLGTYIVVVKLDGFKEVRERVDMGNPDYGANIPTINIILSRNEPEKEETSKNGDVIDIKALSHRFPKKAVEEFEKAQEEDRKGNSPRAIQRLESAIKIAPNFDYAHNQLGLLYEKTKRPEDAEREFKRAHEVNARFFQPLLNLGRIYVQQAENRAGEGTAVTSPILEQARNMLRDAVKLEPYSAPAQYLLGLACYRSALNEEAEGALSRAVENGNKGSARLALTNLYVREMKWAAALEQLDTYLKDNPKAPDRTNLETFRSRIVQNLKITN